MRFKKFWLAALLPAQAFAWGGDDQTIFRVSSTEPLNAVSSSIRSSVLPNDAGTIRLSAKTDIHFKIGDVTVAATPSSSFLPAGTVEYFKINPTDGNYVAVIRDSADGTAYLDVMRP